MSTSASRFLSPRTDSDDIGDAQHSAEHSARVGRRGSTFMEQCPSETGLHRLLGHKSVAGTSVDKSVLDDSLLSLITVLGGIASRSLMRCLSETCRVSDTTDGGDDRIPPDMHVDAGTVSMLDQHALESTIEHLISQSRVQVVGSGIICLDTSFSQSVHQSEGYWMGQALLLLLGALAYREDLEFTFVSEPC